MILITETVASITREDKNATLEKRNIHGRIRYVAESGR